MFDIVDTAFSYEREVIVCSFPQDFSKVNGSSLQLICNMHILHFYFVGQNVMILHPFSRWNFDFQGYSSKWSVVFVNDNYKI